MLRAYRDYHKSGGTDLDNRRQDRLQNILGLISYLSLKNVRVYEFTSGAKFPYTSISLSEVADEIFRKLGGETASQKDGHGTAAHLVPERRCLCKREFILTPIPWRSRHGSWFEYGEFPVRNVLQLLSEALSDRAAGRPVFDYCIYTLGYPTHELGAVTDRYKHELETRRFGGLSKPAYELICNVIETMPKSGSSVVLTGISLGAGVAAQIGGMLYSEPIVRTLIRPERTLRNFLAESATGLERSENHAPLLSVTMYSPAVLRYPGERTIFRKLRFVIGLALEAIVRLTTNPAFREIVLQRHRFERASRAWLRGRSIRVNMDRQQKISKRTCLEIFRDLSVEGLQVPKDPETGEEIPTMQIIGYCDPLISTLADLRMAAAANTKEISIKGSQKNTGMPVKRNKTMAANRVPGTRRVMINMGHLVPFARKSTMATFDNTVLTIEALKHTQKRACLNT